MSDSQPDTFDVAIIGGGPAGLSAAIVLGRCRRRIVLFDHGKPRNYAAQGVHCYLSAEGTPPLELRERGRNEVRSYGVEIIDREVVVARCCAPDDDAQTSFELRTAERIYRSRKLLLATGLVDVLPELPGLKELYGRSVHHCPYCDGWEHRDQRLAAFGDGNSAAGLALALRRWSPHVIALSNGDSIEESTITQLEASGITYREESIQELAGNAGALTEVHFENGPPLPCDALFFSASKVQRSRLPTLLGCATDDGGLIETGKKQGTRIEGLYLAGDADGDVQFAIVAAAEGAVAATAINRALQEEEQSPRR
jgi:thioredoxin reductase